MVQFGKPEDSAHSISDRRKTTDRHALVRASRNWQLDEGAFETGGNMNTKRRTEITVETDRLLVIRRDSGHVFAQCDRCCARIEMVTPMEAAAIAGVPLAGTAWIPGRG